MIANLNQRRHLIKKYKTHFNAVDLVYFWNSAQTDFVFVAYQKEPVEHC